MEKQGKLFGRQRNKESGLEREKKLDKTQPNLLLSPLFELEEKLKSTDREKGALWWCS